MKRLLLLSLLFAALAPAHAHTFREIFGDRYQPNTRHRHGPPSPALDALHRWNQIAINATGLDHTPPAPGENRIFGEHFGPGRSSRAMAIVHVAMFDALDAIHGQYKSFTGVTAPRGPMSSDAAIAQAAHDTLAAIYTSQAASFDPLLAQDLEVIKNPVERANGVALGKHVAAAVLALRQNDGSEVPDPIPGVTWTMSNDPGRWRVDPVSQLMIAVGAHWGECRPFVLNSGAQFRLPPPPSMTSPEYTAAYDEVKRLGGDGIVTPTDRNPEQTFIGTFWAYDGTPSLCAPPRLYNQITVHIADQTHLNAMQLARLLALVNVAMADDAVAAWDSKFHYDLWRPVCGIRESDPGTGPSGRGDGNPDTLGDPKWTPLAAPASNLTGPNFTPPFPSYPSGHATFGGAVFQVLRRFYHTDSMPFTFVSDEFNGVTHGSDGRVRPYRPRSFRTFSQAEAENARSRIYLGVHWNFDATNGITLGRNVGDWVFDHAFRPTHGDD